MPPDDHRVEGEQGPEQDGQRDGPLPGRINLNKIERITIEAQKGRVLPLPPLAGAGVSLTKWVLLIVSVVLAALILLVTCQEIRYTSFTNEIYRKGIPEPQSWHMSNTLKSAVEDLRTIQTRPSESQSILEATATKIAILEQGDSFDAALKDIERDIRNLSAKRLEGDPLNTELTALIARTDARAKSMSTFAASVEQIKASQELLKEYVGAANAARDFWMKIAQLILLNLLLPVLTALLGYVFASKQSGN